MIGREMYDKNLAEELKKRIGEKYRPSNGTEGCAFMEMWCERCVYDRFDEKSGTGGCEILAASLCYAVKDPKYPSEWQYDKDGQPICTKFCP